MPTSILTCDSCDAYVEDEDNCPSCDIHSILAIVEDFVTDEPCDMDDEGYCLTHDEMVPPCPVTELKGFLSKYGY